MLLVGVTSSLALVIGLLLGASSTSRPAAPRAERLAPQAKRAFAEARVEASERRAAADASARAQPVKPGRAAPRR